MTAESVDVDRVEIPHTPDIITQEQLSDLRQAVDPMEQCDDLGVSLYIITREFVYACN